jgi:hypothetical protein
MSAPITNPPATIASGESLSNGCYIGHGRFVSIQMPTGWDAADLTFQGSIDGVTYQDIYDFQGAEVTVKAAASHMVTIDEFMGATWIKVRSGTGSLAVNQNADRILTLVVQKLTGMVGPG